MKSATGVLLSSHKKSPIRIITTIPLKPPRKGVTKLIFVTV